MNIIIMDEEWEQMFQEGHQISSSPMLREFEWKIKVRFFRTPFITSKFSGTSAVGLQTNVGGAVVLWEIILIYFGIVQNY